MVPEHTILTKRYTSPYYLWPFTLFQVALSLTELIHHYALNYSPLNTKYLFTHLGIAAALFTVYIIGIKTTASKYILPCVIMLPIIYFELNTLENSYEISLFAYMLLSISLHNSLLLFHSKILQYASKITAILYLILRVTILKWLEHKLISYNRFLGFLIANIIMCSPCTKISELAESLVLENQNFKCDIDHTFSDIPLPVFKCSFTDCAILKANKEFSLFLERSGIAIGSKFMSLFLEQNQQYLMSVTDKITDLFKFHYNSEYYEVNIKRLDSCGDICLACINNITSIKNYESRKAIDTYKKMFISVVSHQLKTPLNGIYCPLSIINRLNCTPEIQQQVDVALYSVEIMNELVDLALLFEQHENGGIQLNLQEVDFEKDIDRLRMLFAFESKNKGINLIIQTQLASSTIIADYKKLHLLIFILLSNAFKYTFIGTVTLSCKDVECEGSLKKLHITVSDTGIGIKSQQVHYIFNEIDDFNSLSGSTSFGMQLSLVYRLVQLFKGEITVKSNENKGTEFNILIPIEYAESNPISFEGDVKGAAHIIPVFPVQCKTGIRSTLILSDSFKCDAKKPILVVDDNAANVFVLQKMLNILKLSSDIATNGLDCIEKVKRRGIDGYSLILMDINMPLMNGLEATREIRKMEKEGKLKKANIIAVTAQAEANIKDACLEAGIESCIYKPVKMDDLSEIANKMNLCFKACTSNV